MELKHRIKLLLQQSSGPRRSERIAKRAEETKDACIGTTVGTMTEPDCLGHCEPGTSVTLEGIVWHETEGVLVVNVTWRGKTYVGTLLDCSKHEWAPPRFCDSPTEDLDQRLPKGRTSKRGRAATNDLSNFTETRSSVHSKLRSSSNGSNKGARKGLSSSPTPFISPRPESSSGGGSGGSSRDSNKRKSRPSEDELASPQANGKKSKSSSQSAPVSPPSSPVFFECPEANCCKKYRHVNGLKYHTSHAHGNACPADDDDTTKESGSMSENEEIPSPTDQQSIKCAAERKDGGENSESEPATPISEGTAASLTPSSPRPQAGAAGSLADTEPVTVERSPPPVDNKTVVKPGVLRYGVVPSGIDEIGSTAGSATGSAKLTTTSAATGGLRPITTSATNALPPLTLNSTASQSTSPPPPPQPSISQQVPLSPSATASSALPHAFAAVAATQQIPSTQSLPLPTSVGAKLPQFNVKPASVLMQEDKIKDKSSGKCQQSSRKKSRKSPGGSPHAHPIDQSQYKVSESSGREEAPSPAYSDISDDGAPVLEPELADTKNKPLSMDKKTLESSDAHSPHTMPHYGMYSYYAQPPCLLPSVQPDAKSKDDKVAQDGKHSEKDKKENELQPQKLHPQHFYPYDSYVPHYGYNLSQNYPIPMMQPSNSEKDIKEEIKSPGPTDLVKQPSSSVHQSPSVGQYPASLSSKSKVDSSAKMQTEPYGSLKDGPDSRSPLNVSSAYLHSRAPPPPQQPLQQMQQMQPIQAHSQPPNVPHSQAPQLSSSLPPSHHLSQAHQQQQQQHEDMRRYYGGMYPDQRRKESQHTSHSEAPLKATPPPSSKSSLSSLSSSKHSKDKQQMLDDKKEDKVKQEGVKPTMETQGPPPPPTSSYAYFHSGYLQPSPYGVPFDPNHPMYRTTMNPMIVPAGPYGNSPYLHHPAQMHPQMTRYHAPEDLSRPPTSSATKALDLLHHQASQYYPSSHKIHELQERAIKSPTPKVSTTIASPSTAPNGQPSALSTAQLTPTSTSDRLSSGVSSQSGKVPSVDGKDSRSPPPQRHVHTHHHTHVGLGYPLLPGQYAPPYGAAVLASEQAAAVASAGSNPYSPK